MRYRSIEREDLKRLRNWRNRDDIRSVTREYRLLNMVNQEDWLEDISRDKNNEIFIVEIGDSCVWVPIGVCGLCYINWVNRNAEVSIYIGNKKYRGRGLGRKILKFLESKAFKEFNLYKLWAEIFSNNISSIALFKSCGYVEEGRLKRQVFKDGEYQDSVFFSLYWIT